MKLKSIRKINCLTQCALGISGVKTNPDFLAMLQYCRSKGVIPNFTLTGIDLEPDMAKEIAKVCGGLAVSVHSWDKDIGYNTVKTFTDLGVNQTNIHLMVSVETIPFIWTVLNDRLIDPRLVNMRSIVLLGCKPKGRAAGHFHPAPQAEYDRLVRWCLDEGINFGFDSCSAPKFEAAVRSLDLPEGSKRRMIQCSESCESGLFSAYVNTEGKFFPCSFSEGEGEWVEGIDVAGYKDFLRDVWFNRRVISFREKSLASACNGCRKCLLFNLDDKEDK